MVCFRYSSHVIIGAAVLICSPAASANPRQQGETRTLEVGMPAPDFALPDQTGKIHRLSDYRGKTVILAFYPKDMTPG